MVPSRLRVQVLGAEIGGVLSTWNFDDRDVTVPYKTLDPQRRRVNVPNFSGHNPRRHADAGCCVSEEDAWQLYTEVPQESSNAKGNWYRFDQRV